MHAVKRFVYRGITVRVEGPDVTDLDWLVEFLAPSFTVVEADGADRTVTLVADERRHREALGGIGTQDPVMVECFILDRGVVSLPSWPAPEGGCIIVNNDSGVLYRINADHTRVEVISAPANRKRRGDLMRVVREFAMAAAWTRRSLVLHAAAFAAGDRAVLLAGPKHAGKTSLLMACLEEAGIRFMSNDRVVVDLTDAEPVARGMPTIVSIRSDTLDRFPAAKRRLEAIDYLYTRTVAEAEAQRPTAPAARSAQQPLSLSSAQLCRVLGAEMTGAGAPVAIVFPRVDAGIGGIAVRELDATQAAGRLADALLGAATAPRRSQVFVPPGDAAAGEYADVSRVWRTLLTHVRTFECRLGPRAYTPDSRTRFIAQVLGQPVGGR